MTRNYYLPAPYPDELIGSTLVRASRHLGISHKKMHVRLGLLPASHWTLLFQNPAQLIAAALSIPADELLFLHTPFPYVTAFLSLEQTRRLASTYGSSRHTTASALSQSATTGGASARYCEFCIEDDRRDFGEDYWHRRHNLPFVTRCWKHGSLLRKSNQSRAGISVIGLPHEQQGEFVTPIFTEHIHALIEAHSIALLDSTYRQSPEKWQLRYREIAASRGFPHHGGHLSSLAIAQGFLAFYGKAQLKCVGLGVPEKPNQWPVTLLRTNETSNITAKHILMQVYLQNAPVPEAVTTTTPGPAPLDCMHKDPVFAKAIRKRVSKLATGSRITVTELLTQLDILQAVRHHRKELPLTRAAIEDFRHTVFSAHQTGRRPRKPQHAITSKKTLL